MKISYKNLKRYLPSLPEADIVAKEIVLHLAEVEDVQSESKSFENIVFWKITKIDTHENADSLRVCMVDVGETEETQIVCGWSNLEVWQSVAVAKLWASVLWHGEWELVVMKKTAIRWVESFGMICASDEIGLASTFPSKSEKEILDLSRFDAKAGTNIADLMGRNDSIMEIDNKSINHRPDMFSYIGLIRELSVLFAEKMPLEYKNSDFSNLKKLEVKNHIPEIVKRYMALELSGVSNIETPDYIKEVLSSFEKTSKGLLIDMTNYSLYFYGQPMHAFDADKIDGNIEIRFARIWEKIIALDDKEYELGENDIVIADSSKILAIAWIIGGKDSAVSNSTTRIILESANFPQDILRKSGRNLWVRTDSLNVFEKDIPLEMASRWMSLVYDILKNSFPEMKEIAFADVYSNKQKEVSIDFDINYINKLIWAEYSRTEALEIFDWLGLVLEWEKLKVPFWRKDLNYKADLAEEIARIKGYDSITPTIPKVNLGAVAQTNIYKLKQDSRNFFTSKGFFDMYTYSFVNEKLVNKLGYTTEKCVSLKNYLSEELSHMRNSLIPNLMAAVEENYRDFDNLNLFEIEKIFNYGKTKSDIIETYSLAWIIARDEKIVYYEIQNIVSDFLKTIGIDKIVFEEAINKPSYAHSGRIAKIIARGKEIWIVWEIHPQYSANFSTSSRIWFFELNAEVLASISYNTLKYKEISNFQANNFDLSFVVEKSVKWSTISNTISKINPLIKKVELFDIYEDEMKLWANLRSLSFKIFIQSMEWTLDDNVKWTLINDIIAAVVKVWGKLR